MTFGPLGSEGRWRSEEITLALEQFDVAAGRQVRGKPMTEDQISFQLGVDRRVCRYVS